MKGERNLLEQRVNELEDGRATSAKLQERVRSLTDVIAAKDQEMEDDMEVEEVFMAQEVDVDYEFDAARYFDFTREETPAEARRAELWFESAKSYPPSPVVTRLMLGPEILLENVNTSPKCDVENASDGGCLYAGIITAYASFQPLKSFRVVF
ncbi:hypothetical protein ACFX2F_021910 [Malus domestica]